MSDRPDSSRKRPASEQAQPGPSLRSRRESDDPTLRSPGRLPSFNGPDLTPEKQERRERLVNSISRYWPGESEHNWLLLRLRNVATPKNPLDWDTRMLNYLNKLAEATRGDMLRAHGLMERAVRDSRGSFIVTGDLKKAADWAAEENESRRSSEISGVVSADEQQNQQQAQNPEASPGDDENVAQLDAQPGSSAPMQSPALAQQAQSMLSAPDIDRVAITPDDAASTAQESRADQSEATADRHSGNVLRMTGRLEYQAVASQPLRTVGIGSTDIVSDGQQPREAGQTVAQVAWELTSDARGVLIVVGLPNEALAQLCAATRRQPSEGEAQGRNGQPITVLFGKKE